MHIHKFTGFRGFSEIKIVSKIHGRRTAAIFLPLIFSCFLFGHDPSLGCGAPQDGEKKSQESILPRISLSEFPHSKTGWLISLQMHLPSIRILHENSEDPVFSLPSLFWQLFFHYTPPKFNIDPEKRWLEYYFPIGKVTFQVQAVSFREGIFWGNQGCDAVFSQQHPAFGKVNWFQRPLRKAKALEKARWEF